MKFKTSKDMYRRGGESPLLHEVFLDSRRHLKFYLRQSTVPGTNVVQCLAVQVDELMNVKVSHGFQAYTLKEFSRKRQPALPSVCHSLYLVVG